MVLGTPGQSKKYFHDKIESRLFSVAFPNSPDKIEVNDKSIESSHDFRKFWARVIFEDANYKLYYQILLRLFENFCFLTQPGDSKKCKKSAVKIVIS